MNENIKRHQESIQRDRARIYATNLKKQWEVDPDSGHPCCFVASIQTFDGAQICDVSEREYINLLLNAPKMLESLEMVLFECQDTPEQLAVAALSVIAMRIKGVIASAKAPYQPPDN